MFTMNQDFSHRLLYNQRSRPLLAIRKNGGLRHFRLCFTFQNRRLAPAHLNKSPHFQLDDGAREKVRGSSGKGACVEKIPWHQGAMEIFQLRHCLPLGPCYLIPYLFPTSMNVKAFGGAFGFVHEDHKTAVGHVCSHGHICFL